MTGDYSYLYPQFWANHAGTYNNTYFLTNTTTTVYDDSYQTGPLRTPEASAREETPIDWLRRRVDEICWKPE